MPSPYLSTCAPVAAAVGSGSEGASERDASTRFASATVASLGGSSEPATPPSSRSPGRGCGHSRTADPPSRSSPGQPRLCHRRSWAGGSSLHVGRGRPSAPRTIRPVHRAGSSILIPSPLTVRPSPMGGRLPVAPPQLVAIVASAKVEATHRRRSAFTADIRASTRSGSIAPPLEADGPMSSPQPLRLKSTPSLRRTLMQLDRPGGMA
jgi:hypothetical protein